jgi:calcineurin-like phosphoesterase family protein
MNVFLTSDLHLGHINIVDLCNRPFADVDEMNAAIVSRWNATVAEDDVVWVLGDVAMGNFTESMELVRTLQGRKILIPGNHDRISPAYPDQRPGKQREWATMYRRAFFDIYRSEGLTLSLWGSALGGGEPNVRLSHYPYDSTGDPRPEIDQYRPVDDGLPLVHGHVHTAWTTNGRQFNVGVDVHDFTPVSLNVVRDWVGSLT